MIETEVVKNTKWTKQFYNKQNRFKGGKFWDSRKDHSIPAFNPVKQHTISIKKEDKLVFNHKAQMTKIAVVGETELHRTGLSRSPDNARSDERIKHFREKGQDVDAHLGEP